MTPNPTPPASHDDRVEQIRRRADAATPGPWTPVVRDYQIGDTGDWGTGFTVLDGKEQVASLDYTKDEGDQTEANLNFIAASRTDVPYLCDRVTELAAERDQLGVELAKWKDRANGMLAACDRYKAALEKIRDGGVPQGVLANVEQRMLAMCDIASAALAGERP